MMAMDEEVCISIKIIGIGDSGCNILQNMVPNCPKEVELLAINSDARSLENVNGITRIQINLQATEEGTASDIVVARDKAEKGIAEQVIEKIKGADLVFLITDLNEETYFMLSAVAKATKQIQIELTIAIVAISIQGEAATRWSVAGEAISELIKQVHLLIPMSTAAMRLSEFNKNAGQDDITIRNEIFCKVIKGIYESLTSRGMVGIDFADYKTIFHGERIFHGAGIASVGLGRSNARVDRGKIAAKMALSNPLTVHSLDECSTVFASIACGSFKCLQDFLDASAEIQTKYYYIENFIFGVPVMESMKNEVQVLVAAAGSELESLESSDPSSVGSEKVSDSGNKKDYPRLTGRAKGVVSGGNTVEIPYHWQPVFQHLKITKITVSPVHDDNPRLIVYPKVSEKILQKSIIEIKKYFDKHLFFPEFNLNKFKKMLRESVHVDIDANNTVEISSELLRHAGIRRNIIFVGMLSNFEIWSSSVYMRYSAKVKADFDKFLKDNNIE